jgi:predicted pyridoxine 5'-phosphate oxidase superfamily flavin-nucleotide-binding protein
VEGGAVRVVRALAARRRSSARHPHPAGVANTAFYPAARLRPGTSKLPISPGVDLPRRSRHGRRRHRDLRGWRFVAPGTPPEGFAIDGAHGRVERAFRRRHVVRARARRRWRPRDRSRSRANLRGAIPFDVVYVDDATRAAPRRARPGSVPLVGFTRRGIEKLRARSLSTSTCASSCCRNYREATQQRVLASATAARRDGQPSSAAQAQLRHRVGDVPDRLAIADDRFAMVPASQVDAHALAGVEDRTAHRPRGRGHAGRETVLVESVGEARGDRGDEPAAASARAAAAPPVAVAEA